LGPNPNRLHAHAEAPAPGRLLRSGDLDAALRRHPTARDRRPRPKALSRLGYYGLQPLAWLGGSALLVGLRTEWGNEAATIGIATKRLRPFGRYSRTGSYYVDKASRDGQLALGAGGNEKVTISIIRVSDGHPLFTLRGYVCCPDWNR
jgi:hypothetical protein